MTAVAAYTNGEKVWMAGDSFCGHEESTDLCAESKIIPAAQGKLLVGVCGTIRQSVVLESTLRMLDNMKPEIITADYIRNDFPTMFLQQLEEHNALPEMEGQKILGNAGYLFAIEGRIFYMEADFGVWESSKPIAAIGAGRTLVVGALSRSYKTLAKSTKPQNELFKALEVASEWSA